MIHQHGTRYTACGIPLDSLPAAATTDEQCQDCAMASRVGTDMRWRTGRALRTAARDWSDKAITSESPR